MSDPHPQPGQFWRHRNGIRYLVLTLTNQHSTNDRYQPQVVYSGPGNRIWSRPLGDWHRSMTLENRDGEPQ